MAVPDPEPDTSGLTGVYYQSWPQPDGGVRLEFLSAGADALVEMSAEELAARLAAGTLPLTGVDEAAFYAGVAESVRRHAPWAAEFGFVGPRTGRVRWLRAQDFPRVGAGGERYFSGTLVDVTALKDAEARSERSRRLLEGHLANTPLAVIEWDAGFRVTRWAGQAAALFGWAADEVLGRTPDEFPFVHPDDRERVAAAAARLRDGVEPRSVVVNRNLDRAGRELTCEWHNSVVATADGGRSILSLVQDLTEPQRVLRELAVSEERLRAALRFGGMLGWDYDLAARRLHFSDPAGDFFGRPDLGPTPGPDELRGTIHPDDMAALAAAVDRLEATGELNAEYRGARADAAGRPRWYSCRGTVVRDAAGRPARVVGLTVDVTDRKRADAERAELDRQLAEARQYEALGVLAGGIAHDFNNQLTVILGNAGVAREGTADPTLVAHLADIESAAVRAADLCNQLTAYAGVGRLAVGPVAVGRLLADHAPALHAAAGRAVLRLHAAADLPAVVGDPRHLRQLFQNLIANGAAALDGPGTVEVRVDAPAADRLRIRVTDTGRGLDGAARERMFEPFFAPDFAGRGLGLAVVKGVVRAHKGTIRVESEPGRGTTVEIDLPAVAAAAAAGDSARGPAPVDRRPARGALVVDDESNIRELIASLLEDDGYRVAVAANGAEAVACFAADPAAYDLAVVDLMMPDVGGDEVIRRLRRLRAALPVVIASGYTDRLLPDDLLASGPTVVLTKPFRLDAFSAAVRTVVEALVE